jgi:hypothetical protein
MVRNSKKEIMYFLKATPHLNNLSDTLILSLSKRFKLKPQHFVLLVKINALNGGFYEN